MIISNVVLPDYSITWLRGSLSAFNKSVGHIV